jgi:hypothetical protein
MVCQVFRPEQGLARLDTLSWNAVYQKLSSEEKKKVRVLEAGTAVQGRFETPCPDGVSSDNCW